MAMRKKDTLGEITLVASDNQNAQGLKTAAQLGIPVFQYISDTKILDIKSFEKQILHTFEANNISLICLAGFMRILSPQFLKLFSGKIINIHPSILPSLKGLDTHRRALEKNLQVHGATVQLTRYRSWCDVPRSRCCGIAAPSHLSSHHVFTPARAARRTQRERGASPEDVDPSRGRREPSIRPRTAPRGAKLVGGDFGPLSSIWAVELRAPQGTFRGWSVASRRPRDGSASPGAVARPR